MTPSLDAARTARDDARQGNLRENDAGIPDEDRIDYEDAEGVEVQLRPEVLVTYDHVASININTYGNADSDELLSMEQNLGGAGPQGYGFDAQVTLADPAVGDGTIWAEDPDAEYPTYYIIGDPEDEFNPYETNSSVVRDEDDNIVGEEVDGVRKLPGRQEIDAEPLDDLDVDFIEVTVGGRRAEQLLGLLDTAGQWFTDQEGNVTEGLFETPPNFGTDAYDAEDGPNPRLVGYPDLRADMASRRGAIGCLYRDDVEEPDPTSPYEVTVFTLDEDGTIEEALTPLTPEDPAYNKPEYPRTGNTYWDHDADSEASAEPDTNGGVEAAQDMMSGDDPTYEGLTESEQQFVDDAVGVMESQDLDTIYDLDGEDTASDYDSFAERVELATSVEDANADDLAWVIDEQGSS